MSDNGGLLRLSPDAYKWKLLAENERRAREAAEKRVVELEPVVIDVYRLLYRGGTMVEMGVMCKRLREAVDMSHDEIMGESEGGDG